MLCFIKWTPVTSGSLTFLYSFILISQVTVLGVPGVHGQHAPKLVVQEHRTASGHAKASETAQVQMKRTATVTYRIVLVSQDLSFRKVHDIRYQSLISEATSGDTSLVERKIELSCSQCSLRDWTAPIFCSFCSWRWLGSLERLECMQCVVWAWY